MLTLSMEAIPVLELGDKTFPAVVPQDFVLTKVVLIVHMKNHHGLTEELGLIAISTRTYSL